MDTWNIMDEYDDHFDVGTDFIETSKCYVNNLDTTAARMSYARAYPWPVAI